ncbi:MAG: peptidylprolyl isomerase [Alphaproteobacteria bacterium]
MKRAYLPGAALILTLGIQSAASAQTIQPVPVDPVAATVNGEEILGSDVKILFDTLPEQYRQYPLEMLYKQLLDQLIDQKLVAGAARKDGYMDDPEIRRRIASVIEGMIHQIYMERLIRRKITEARLRAAYEEVNRGAARGEEVHARHILVKTEEEALAIIKELQGGADFAATAEKKSIGPSKRQGGDLGFFAPGQMVPAFSEVAFKLKPGDVTTRPVKTQFGWHIIKVEERRRAGMASFKDSKDEIRSQLVEALTRETIARLRAKADIKMPQGGGIQRVP